MQSKPKKNKMDLNAFDSDEEQSPSVSETDFDKNFEQEYANYLKMDLKTKMYWNSGTRNQEIFLFLVF